MVTRDWPGMCCTSHAEAEDLDTWRRAHRECACRGTCGCQTFQPREDVEVDLRVPEDRQTEAVRQAQEARREQSIQQRFLEFHAANPQVYDLLVRFSRQLASRGYGSMGIALIWERMRWEMVMATTDPDGFKLNNDYRSRYARLIMEQEPDLVEFFRTRELRAS